MAGYQNGTSLASGNYVGRIGNCVFLDDDEDDNVLPNMVSPCPNYRAEKKGWYVVARYFFLALLSFSGLSLAGCSLAKFANLFSLPCTQTKTILRLCV